MFLIPHECQPAWIMTLIGRLLHLSTTVVGLNDRRICACDDDIGYGRLKQTAKNTAAEAAREVRHYVLSATPMDRDMGDELARIETLLQGIVTAIDNDVADLGTATPAMRQVAAAALDLQRRVDQSD